MAPPKKKAKKVESSSESSSESDSSSSSSSSDSADTSRGVSDITDYLKKATLTKDQQDKLRNILKTSEKGASTSKGSTKRTGKKPRKAVVDPESSDLSDLRVTDDGNSADDLPSVNTKKRGKSSKKSKSKERRERSHKKKTADKGKKTPQKQLEKPKTPGKTPTVNPTEPPVPLETPSKSGRPGKQTRGGRPILTWLSSEDEPDPIDMSLLSTPERKRMEQRQRNVNWTEEELLIIYVEGRPYQ